MEKATNKKLELDIDCVVGGMLHGAGSLYAGIYRRAWGGTTIRVPRYNLEVSRAGFIYRGANLFNSLTLNIREEKKTLVFKASVKKWVKENIGIRPNR